MAQSQDDNRLGGQDAREPRLACCGSARSSVRRYEIRVEGHLNSQWSDWLEGLELELLENGETVLRGPIVDQAALMGVLNKLHRLNLTILSLNPINRSA